MTRRSLLALLGVSAVLAAPSAVAAEPYKQTTQATASGTGGAAASVDSVATSAARDVLRRGGNAVDAAVAAAAVLGVTEPYSCGVGGGGFMVIRTPHGKVTTIDSRETAPQEMRPDSFFENGAVLPFNDARYSGLSAGVPGTVAAWDQALRRYGSWRFKDALAPAIDVAEKGFVVDDTFASQTTPNIPWFDDIPSTAELYLDPDGTARDPGTILRNPDLAKTYERIARRGADGFYRGRIAAAIVAAARKPPTGPKADKKWRPGLLSLDDLARYRAKWRDPTRVGYRGYDVYSMGPPSSGGSTVGEALNILEQIPDYQQMSDEDKMHYFLEASRYAFADRNVFVADPDYFSVPLRGLLSDSFAAERAALIGETDPNRPVAPGDPYPHQHGRTGEGTFSPTQSTTHLTVADRHGMVVSYTFTIESTGGNAIVVPDWGFLLNNELTDFNIDDPAHANAPAAGKRPRSSIAPTYVAASRAPVRRARLAGRRHDHHDGAAAADRADRLRTHAPGGDRRPAGEPAQPAADRRQLADRAGAGVHRPSTARRSPRAGIRSAPRPRSGRPRGSSSCRTAASSPPPSRCGVAEGRRRSCAREAHGPRRNRRRARPGGTGRCREARLPGHGRPARRRRRRGRHRARGVDLRRSRRRRRHARVLPAAARRAGLHAPALVPARRERLARRARRIAAAAGSGLDRRSRGQRAFRALQLGRRRRELRRAAARRADFWDDAVYGPGDFFSFVTGPSGSYARYGIDGSGPPDYAFGFGGFLEAADVTVAPWSGRLAIFAAGDAGLRTLLWNGAVDPNAPEAWVEGPNLGDDRHYVSAAGGPSRTFLSYVDRRPRTDSIYVRRLKADGRYARAKRVVRYDPVEIKLVAGPRGEFALLYRTLKDARIVRSRNGRRWTPRAACSAATGSPTSRPRWGRAAAGPCGTATRATPATARSARSRSRAAAPLGGAREVGQHRQHGAGAVDDGVRVGQRLGRERPGRDRDHAHAVGARAGDVARRVADHDRPLPRPAAGPGARDRRQRGAVLGVAAEPALAGGEVVADARARELAPRHRLEVPGEQREPVRAGLGRERGERLGHAGRDVRGEVRRAELLVGGDGRSGDLGRAGVDRRRRRRRLLAACRA